MSLRLALCTATSVWSEGPRGSCANVRVICLTDRCHYDLICHYVTFKSINNRSYPLSSSQRIWHGCLQAILGCYEFIYNFTISYFSPYFSLPYSTDTVHFLALVLATQIKRMCIVFSVILVFLYNIVFINI